MRRAVIAAQCPVGELWAGVMIQELPFFFCDCKIRVSECWPTFYEWRELRALDQLDLELHFCVRSVQRLLWWQMWRMGEFAWTSLESRFFQH